MRGVWEEHFFKIFAKSLSHGLRSVPPQLLEASLFFPPWQAHISLLSEGASTMLLSLDFCLSILTLLSPDTKWYFPSRTGIYCPWQDTFVQQSFYRHFPLSKREIGYADKTGLGTIFANPLYVTLPLVLIPRVHTRVVHFLFPLLWSWTLGHFSSWSQVRAGSLIG